MNKFARDKQKLKDEQQNHSVDYNEILGERRLVDHKDVLAKKKTDRRIKFLAACLALSGAAVVWFNLYIN